MKKYLLIAGSVFLITTNLFAQYTLDWMQISGADGKTSVMSVVDSSDNLTVTGNYASQIFTRKYDLFGTLLWEVQDSSGIHSIYEKPNWINCDSSNNILVVGNLYSSSGSYDYPQAIVALKYSPSGTLLWRTVIPISVLINSSTSFDCRSVVDANGNLYIGTAIVNGAFLYKMDTNGNLIFTDSSAINAPKNFNGMRIRNNKIVIGTSSGTPNVAPVFVWDTTGTLLWTANAIGTLAADVEFDENENVYVLGSLYYMVNPITWDYDVKLTKFSSTGNLLWTYNYDFGAYNFATRMTYVNNRISAIGYGSSSGINWVTFQTDTSGTLLWSAIYDSTSYNDEYPHSILAKPTGEVIVTGVGGPSFDPFNPSYIQMPIVEYSNTGTQIWMDTPNIYGGTGLATMFASDGSMYAISSRNMTVYHYNSMPVTIDDNLQLENPVNIFPNPVCSSATLEFSLSETKNISISIVDVTGRTIKTISTKSFLPGKNNVNLNLVDVICGMYFCNIKFNENTQTIKLINY